MTKNKNIPKGKLGEKYALRYLQKKGYKVISQNFRTRLGEIDIIASLSDITVFVEVKTRTSDYFGNPEEAVNAKKLHKITKVAHIFMQKNSKTPKQMRIDVISTIIDGEGKLVSLKHFKGVGQ